MQRIQRFLMAWCKFRILYYLPFLRPARIVFKGRIRFDWVSFIDFDQESTVTFETAVNLKKSRVYFRQSKVHLTGNAQFAQSIVTIEQSQFKTGAAFRCNQVQVGLYENTNFSCGDHVLIDGSRHARSGFSAYGSNISWQNNVTHYAHTVCQNGIFTVGDNVFFNQGTQMRCHIGLHFGSNILVSYECIIFDTNTHSVSAADRRKEIENGYPNKSYQTKEDQEKVKKAPIRIDNDVWIGTRALIFKGTTLEDEVIVGAACVIAGLHAPKGSRVIGNPGKVIT